MDKKMKIGIDISQVIYETGVSTYTRNLVTSVLLKDKVNDYILFGGSLRRRSDLAKFIGGLSGNVSSKINIISPTLGSILWNRLRIFPLEYFIGKVDLVHISDWTVPPTSAKIVTTIHDMVPVKFPNLTNPKIVSNFNHYIKLIKKNADAIIVPSQTTKNDMLDYGFKKQLLHVIPEAVDPSIKIIPGDRVAAYKREHNLPQKYLLVIGASDRKNIKRIISAYELVKKVHSEIGLIIVGKNYTKGAIPDGIKFLGHVANSEIPYLYCGAEILLYPSLYEGFGLPILEAYTCGIPVVTSNIGSMKELGEEGAELVDPNDVSDIQRGIFKVIGDRHKYINRGYNSLQKYSWDNTAKMTVDLYKNVL